MNKKNESDPKWDVKVSSKGQITLPKKARDLMMVREGDRLEAVIRDHALVLTRRDELSYSERSKLEAAKWLREMGVDPEKPQSHREYSNVRDEIGELPFLMSDRIRSQREGKDEP